MRKLSFVLLMAIILPFTTIARTIAPEGIWIRPTDKNIQYVGRISFKNPESPLFTYPGVQINTCFTGSSLKMVAKPMSGYFMAQIDNAKPFKVSFYAPKDSIVTLATALPKGNHQVKLMYIVEGYELRPEFRGFIVDNGESLKPAPKLPERKIEFIGNSITCGYGTEGANGECHFLYETENHYYTYAALAAKNLDAQYQVVSRSGIGVYRNYNGPKSGNEKNMRYTYDYTLFMDESEKWDFSRFVPDVICINLGTNDTSTKNYDTSLLTDAYIKLVNQVRRNNPKAKIVMLCGSMMSGKQLADAKSCIDKAVETLKKNGENRIYKFDFTPADGSLGYGSDYHPSIAQHDKMAKELTTFLKKLMNW